MKTRAIDPDKVFDVVNKVLIILFVLIVLYPLIYIVSASVSDPYYVNSGQMWLLPKGFTLEGYRRIFQSRELLIGYRNTIMYTLLGTFINLAVTLPAAASIWNIIVTMTFFKMNIPKGLEEAAEIDGASHIRIFFQLILPLSAPIIAVMALFYGVGHWNQYFGALIYLQDRALWPLQLFLREILIQQKMMTELMQQRGVVEALQEHARIADIIKYAVMIISSAPLLIIYPFLQRFFVKGIMIGSIKE